MQFSLNTKLIDKNSLEDKILIASKTGWGSVELWIDDIDCKKLTHICSILNDNNLTVSSMEKLDGWFENDGGLMGVKNDHKSIMDECKRRMEITAELGCKYIIACPSFSHRGFKAELTQGVDHFCEMLEIGRTIGVLPTIEFMGQTAQINTIDKCLEFLQHVDDPDAKMVIDAYHLWKGQSFDKFTSEHLKHVSVLHVSDANPNIDISEHRDRDRIMPGDGCIDLNTFAEKTKDFNGHVCIGVYNPIFWEQDPYMVAQTGLIKMKKVFNV